MWRLVYIVFVLVKSSLNKLFSNKSSGVQLREILETLGPIFVKFGQIASTRLDLLPEEIAQELAKLQDNVPAFSGIQAQEIIKQALGLPINAVFSTFSTVPLASASVAQVHAATLPDGTEVIVKVLRPNIKKQIQQDINLLLLIAKFLQLISTELRKFKPYAFVLEFKKSLYDELDLIREAANAAQLKRNFKNSELLYVPDIYWDLTRENILVMERVYGIKISDLDQLITHKINLKLLAERGVEIFFTQVFRDCFFHADMHPGNIWICPKNPNSPRYIAVDFGIMGSLNNADQRYLAENFLAFFKRNYRRIAELHIESGWVPHNTRADEFEAAIRCVCEPIFAKPLKDISFGKTLLRLIQTAKRFDLQLQPQFLLLQKTLVNIEGLGRYLYPELDLWHTAKPCLEAWMKQRLGGKNLLRQFGTNSLAILEKLPNAPLLLMDLMQRAINSNNLDHNKQYKTQTNEPKTIKHGFYLGLATALLTITSIVYFFPNIFANFSRQDYLLGSLLLIIFSLGMARF